MRSIAPLEPAELQFSADSIECAKELVRMAVLDPDFRASLVVAAMNVVGMCAADAGRTPDDAMEPWMTMVRDAWVARQPIGRPC